MAAPTLSWSREQVPIPELPQTPPGQHVHHCACGRYAFCAYPKDQCPFPTPTRCTVCEVAYVALMQRTAAGPTVPFSVESIFGALTMQGLVKITLGKQSMMVDVRKAREIHAMLGQAIEAAISDEAFVKFMTTRAGLTVHAAALALGDLREIRQGTRDLVRPF